MIKFGIIGSGSKANSYIFSNDDFSFVIDNGYSFKEFESRCKELNFNLDKIKFLFLTHTHSDHKKGVETLLKRLDIPVLFHEGLEDKNISKTPIIKKFKFKWDTKYKINENFYFTPFKIFHDVPYSSGFYFTLEKFNFSLITDTGKYNNIMLNYGLKSDIIFLEANYDPDLLNYGQYPEYLKKRISSENGHLSNYQSLSFVNEMIKSLIDKNIDNVNNINVNKLNKYKKEIYLCHLSDNNNSPVIVKNTFLNGLIKKYKNLKGRITLENDKKFFTFNIENDIIKFRFTVMPRNEKLMRKLS